MAKKLIALLAVIMLAATPLFVIDSVQADVSNAEIPNITLNLRFFQK